MSDDAAESASLTYLEFYSGIGGWTLALERACAAIAANTAATAKTPCATGSESPRILKVSRLAFFDNNDTANSVMDHNFPSDAAAAIPIKSRKSDSRAKKARLDGTTASTSIEKISKKRLQGWNADIWVMSPPCQPHTRQHDKPEDETDQRSRSFLHLCDCLGGMSLSTLPKLVLLENVVGFELSNSCKTWRTVLTQRNYSVGHFHLSPPQVGIPNDRPRYYCVAVLDRQTKVEVSAPPSLQSENINDEILTAEDSQRVGDPHRSLATYLQQTDPAVKDGEPLSPPIIISSIPELNVPSVENASASLTPPPIINFLDNDLVHKPINEETLSSLRIPPKILSGNASWCFDIVTPRDGRSACFTHSYGRFVRGTGSALYVSQDDKEFRLVPPDQRTFDKDWAKGMDLERNLRYFSGTEVARLLGFPVRKECAVTGTTDMEGNFSFPPTCSLKQQWKLTGNSLSVSVAAKVAELGMLLAFGG